MGEAQRRARERIVRLSTEGLDWVTFATEATEVLRGVVPFSRSCWHTVDPGTVLFTGNLSQAVSCSGTWLAEHEYVIDDVNKWQFLARSGRRAGATSIATHGDLRRSPRHRSQAAYDIGDELRGAFVTDGTYWAAAGFLRNADEQWFTEDEVATLAGLCAPIADGFRRALVHAHIEQAAPATHGPGVVVFDESGVIESLSPAAERWIAEMVEIPPPRTPGDSKVLQVVAARARATTGPHAMEQATRSRVQTRGGEWLLLYGTRLHGDRPRTAVILQPATRAEVAPLVAMAYGLSERECDVARACIQGRSTKEMARLLLMSPYTVQDHLKSIFAKTGVRSRAELVGQVFLEHYLPQWEECAAPAPSWSLLAAHLPAEV